MRRSLFASMSFVSLAVFFLAVWMWARSYYRYHVFVHDGRIWLIGVEDNDDAAEWFSRKPMTAEWANFHPQIPPERPPSELLGFGFQPRTQITCSISGGDDQIRDTFCYWMLAVPCWLFVLLAAVPPGAYALGWYTRKRRVVRGRCRNCGYNLVGNMSHVCPECGTPTTAGVKA